MRSFLLVLCIACISTILHCKKFSDEKEKPEWAKKDIRDYSDADLERLLDQWEEDEEPLPEDELPEHLRPPVPIDMTKFDASNPESIVKATKKGKTLMMFVSVAKGNSKKRAEELTKLWQTGLWNSHIQAERYMVDDDRAIFMFKDGSLAWEAKDFLIEQDECQEVTIEGQTYKGKHPDKRNTVLKFDDEL